MPTLVKPNEVMFAYLAAQPALGAAITVGGVRHLYGPPGLPANWTLTKALMFLGDGGPSQEHLPMEYGSFQFRTYAPTPWDAEDVHLLLTEALLHKNATPVAVTGGNALFQFAERLSGPHNGVEPMTLFPFTMSLWKVHIGQYLLPS